MKGILLLVLLLYGVWMWSTLESRSLYFPSKRLDATPQVYQLAYEELALETSDGNSIHGWLIPKAGAPGARFTVLLCHGNAGNISHRLDKVLKLHRAGLDVLVFDYRGYGKSEGRPSETGTYRDAEAAYDYLVKIKKIPQERVVLYGESLGSAIATEIALHHPAAALVLESPFTSTVAMGKLVYPWLPVAWMVRNKYDTLAKIPQVTVPLLILHSPQDEIVPFAMAEQLLAAAPSPKKLHQLSGGHNDGFDRSPEYSNVIKAFLNNR